MHGQFPHGLNEKVVDKQKFYGWLIFGNIKGESESTAVAAQNRVICATASREMF